MANKANSDSYKYNLRFLCTHIGHQALTQTTEGAHKATVVNGIALTLRLMVFKWLCTQHAHTHPFTAYRDVTQMPRQSVRGSLPGPRSAPREDPITRRAPPLSHSDTMWNYTHTHKSITKSMSVHLFQGLTRINKSKWLWSIPLSGSQSRTSSILVQCNVSRQLLD